MTPDDLLRHLESLLFVSSEPAEVSQLAAALEVTVPEVNAAIDEFAERCKWRGIRVLRKGQRVQLSSSPDASIFVEKYLGLNAVTRLSQAALETLAIIAYRQPITRPEIEVLRGVDCDGVLRTLTARQLIVEVGRLDSVGHPIRYGTTFEFLRYFGLERLDQMPSLSGPEPAPITPHVQEPGVAAKPDSAGKGNEEQPTDEDKDPRDNGSLADDGIGRRAEDDSPNGESWSPATSEDRARRRYGIEADAPSSQPSNRGESPALSESSSIKQGVEGLAEPAPGGDKREEHGASQHPQGAVQKAPTQPAATTDSEREPFASKPDLTP